MGMTRLRHVQAFVEASRGAATMDELRHLTGDAVVELGFDYFALLHHVNFAAPPPGTFQVGTVPVGWLGVQRERRYLADDPVVAAWEVAYRSRLSEALKINPNNHLAQRA